MSVVPAIGWFGKLPWHGDFLREEPAGAPLDLIDAWLAPVQSQGGLAALDGRGPALAMVRARGAWWALSLFPSQDAVGRRYPFCILAGLPEAEFGGEPGLVPAAWLPLLGRTLHLAARGWPQDAAGLRQAVPACAQPIDLDHEGRRLVEQLADHHLSSLWRALFGSADDPRRDGWFADLAALAGDPGRATGLRLRPMAHQLHLVFLLMVRHILGDSTGAPVLIGVQPGSPGEAAAATVLWGRPSAAECLAALWPDLPGSESTRIHDPTAAPGTFGDAETAPEALADPTLSLRDLLHEVGSATRRIVRRNRTA